MFLIFFELIIGLCKQYEKEHEHILIADYSENKSNTVHVVVENSGKPTGVQCFSGGKHSRKTKGGTIYDV